MNNNDNGFNKAQREYDNMLPPDDGEGDDECPDCEGSGELQQSNCCGDETVDSDILICPSCKEHCELDKCERCDGTGHLNVAKERQEAYEEYMEKKADEARDELPDISHGGSDIDRLLDHHIEGKGQE